MEPSPASTLAALWRDEAAMVRRRGGPCKHVVRVGLASGDRSVIEGLRALIPNPRHFPPKRRQGAA